MIANVKIKKPIEEIWQETKVELLKLNVTKLAKIVEAYDKKLIKWSYGLKKHLNNPIPKKYIGKRRPANRRWTYKLSGKQIESIKTKINMAKQGNGFIIHSWAEIGVPYAKYTDLGKPKRADGKKPQWQDWVYDVLFNKGRDGLISVGDIFDQMVEQIRREL